MTIRISTQALHDTISQAVLEAQQKAMKLQRGIADGKAIRTPSDDPVGTHISMRYREWLRAGEQYQKNLELAVSHLDSTDATLFGIDDLLTEARILQNRGSDDSNAGQVRISLAQQVDQIIQSLVDLGNERFAGVHIFGGTQSLTAPYTATLDENGLVAAVTVNPEGIDDPVKRQIGQDLSLSIHVSGSDVFGDDLELFDSLLALRDGLLNDDQAAVASTRDALESAQDRVIGAHALVGSLLQRAESLRTRLQSDETTNEAGRSRIEDLDVAEALLEFNQSEVALQAALKAGAQILQASLLDYL